MLFLRNEFKRKFESIFKITAACQSNVTAVCFKKSESEEMDLIEGQTVCLLTEQGSILRMTTKENFEKFKQSCTPEMRLKSRNVSKNQIFRLIF